MKHILVTGANGQLGSKIQEKIIQGNYKNPIEERPKWHFLSRDEFDLTDSCSMEAAIKKYHPDIIVNCAAYTDVNKAETDELSAFEVNAYGPRKLAELCKENNIFLIHISTDFVFSGSDLNKPIKEDTFSVNHKLSPLNVYGNSKYLGEFYVEISGCKYIIIRTSWLYGDGAENKNFVNTIVDKLISPQNCSDISVVISEVGSPTYTGDLADFIILITNFDYENSQGIYHYCNHGVISRYDFAKAIQEILQDLDIIDNSKNVVPSLEFDKKVRRPAYSVLDNTKAIDKFCVSIPYWRDSLAEAMILLLRNKGIIQ